MPERSIAYRAMRRALLGYVRAIPAGQVVEVGVLAGALNIPARHAAHILSGLRADEAAMIAWHRVVPRGGVFTDAQRTRPRIVEQIRRLRADGVPVSADGRITDAPARFWQPPDTHRATLWADAADEGEPA